jgi:long-chain acyl-CoA synthetase
VDEDGYVYVVGRLSDLIIRGGVNISPGEVERALRGHPSVVDVSVIGLPDDIYGERVVAVVISDGTTLDEDSLRLHAERSLTAYKRPSEYVQVDRFPVTGTGKVDRRSLAAQLARASESI